MDVGVLRFSKKRAMGMRNYYNETIYHALPMAHKQKT